MKPPATEVENPPSSNVNEEPGQNLYKVIVHYGGKFKHHPVFKYTSKKEKILEGIDLEAFSVPELKVCLGELKIFKEVESLYYKREFGIRLLTRETKAEWISLSQSACDNTATLFVYHQTPVDWDDGEISPLTGAGIGDDYKVLRIEWRGKYVDLRVDVDKSTLLDIVLTYEDEAKKQGINLDYQFPTFAYVFEMKHHKLLVDSDLMTMFQRLSGKSLIPIWVGTTITPNTLYKLVLNLKKENESKQAVVDENEVDDDILDENQVDENVVDENQGDENLGVENLGDENLLVENVVDDVFLDDDNFSCSDEEYVEIRKRSKIERLRMNEYEREAEILHGSGSESYTSDCSGSFDGFSDEESDENVCYATPSQQKKYKRVADSFNPNSTVKEIKWKVGLVFASKGEFKDAVRSCSMETGRSYNYVVDDLKRMQVGCAKGCPFKIWVTYIENTKSWQVKTVLNDQNCVWNYNNKLVTVKWLASKYGDKIRKNPNWKLGEMQEEFKKVLKVDVGEWKCCRVRQRALRGIEDKMKEHYANVRKFGGEILRSNPNNTVKNFTTRLQEGDEPRFQRMYICYDALKKSWKEGCRRVLGLDGCFLKTVTAGQLLSAVGRDGNNCIMPVVMAVVESENYESWKRFLELLIVDLDLGQGTSKTIISDQQKGLDKAIRELLPFVEHRFCTRHLVSNLTSKYPTEAVKNAFWNASTATHPQAFKTAMKDLQRHSKGAFEKMNDLDPCMWSKAYFKTHSMTDSTENNMSECFNSWILKARYMPLIDMLIEIHDMIMTRLHENRDRMANLDCIIVPRMKKILDEAVKESVGYKALWDGRDSYVVKGNGRSCSVSLSNRTCSCRVWDLRGIPCSHACTAIQQARKNPIDYVAKWFTKETYIKTYSNCLEILKGEEFWEDVEGDIVLPPRIVKSLRGRPKKLRRREGWEGSVSSGKYQRMSYKGRKMHCGYRGAEGHRINKCTEKPEGYAPPQRGNKRGRPKKNKEAVVDETEQEARVEKELQIQEAVTGEAEMMDELLNQMESDTQEKEPIPRLDDDNVESFVPPQKSAMKFMPTPGSKGINTHAVAGSTPPASTPPNVQKKGRQTSTSSQLSKTHRPMTRSASASVSKHVKKFAPPRQQKK